VLADVATVTQPSVDLISHPSGSQLAQLVTPAHHTANTHVLAVSLSVSAALLVCLVVIVSIGFLYLLTIHLLNSLLLCGVIELQLQ